MNHFATSYHFDYSSTLVLQTKDGYFNSRPPIQEQSGGNTIQ